MRIAQVAPLYESVPPRLYGGTERVVHYLTEQLVSYGHDVTLFASGDSQTTATLVPVVTHSLRLHNSFRDPIMPHALMLEMVRRLKHNFDIVHFHLEYLQFLVTPYLEIPHLTTVHGNLESQESRLLLDTFGDEPLASISLNQRVPVPDANWVSNIYHGLPPSLYRPYNGHPEDYLVFIGRVSPEKRLDRAIQIAEATKTQLIVAAKVDAHDLEYFNSHIKPRLNSNYVHFIDEIDDVSKARILSRAKALLFPIDWSEPFGLVMIEALSCGVPVIAFANGSVPEIIDNGLSGFVVHNIKQAIHAVKNLHLIDRKECRKVFNKRFSAERMTQGYLDTYKHLIENFSRTERFHMRFASQHGQFIQQ